MRYSSYAQHVLEVVYSFEPLEDVTEIMQKQTRETIGKKRGI
jgi:hypothetical protein